MIPSLGNHLWQTTLCVAAAALLARCVGARHPQARYGIWLAASVKFLIPFSVFVVAGQQLTLWTLPSLDVPAVPAGLQAIGQPFSGWVIQASTAPAPAAPFTAGGVLPLALSALWLAGAAATLGLRLMQRLRMAAIAARSPVLSCGREVDALGRVLARSAIRRRVTIRESAGPVGPGVLGWFRPVLLWPAGLSARLTDAGIQAVISHEIGHVRRGDNLTALMHMLVETVFWFHPLVWWLGAKLIDDRERACDQDALALGAQAETYAESLLNVCRFSLRSPQPALTGITSSDLSQRVEAIMTYRSGASLDIRRRLLIASGAALIVAGPLAVGVMTAPPSQQPRVVPAVELPVPVEVEAPAVVLVPVVPVALPVPLNVAAPVVEPLGAQGQPQMPRPVPRPTMTRVRPIQVPSASSPEPRPQPAAQTPPRDPAPPSKTELDAAFRRGALPAVGTPGLTPPSVVKDVKPAYTSEAMRQKLQGSIELEVVIAADGTVDRARVVKSLDSVHGLDEAALSAIREWTFEPAEFDDKPVAVWSPIVMDFRLH